MDPELAAKLDALEKKVEETGHEVRRMERYFFWTLVITVAVIVLPLIGLVFVIPQFLSTYQNLGI